MPREPLIDGEIRARVVKRVVDEDITRAAVTDRTDALLARLEERN